MNAAELLADLARQGFILAPEGDGIRVTPASRLTGELRQAIAALKPALLALLAAVQRPAPAFIWDQAEAERLLAEVRETLARVEADVTSGKVQPVRASVMRLWLEVGENCANDREREAGRGWDAMKLLRGTAWQALRTAAGDRPPPFAYTPEEESRLCRWLESYSRWPVGNAILWGAMDKGTPT